MSLNVISSQDFRNAYEKFYQSIRRYLWPYQTLQVLADVECNIYSSFIDFDALKNALYKLFPLIKDEFADNEQFESRFNDILNLIDEATNPEYSVYLRLDRVKETDPDLNKILKDPNSKDEEDTNENY